MSLARRSLTSISWNFAANTAAVGILAVRMVLLTRWLTPEIYGVYAFTYAILILTIIIPNFGMEEAFVHRAPEVENESDAAAVHFTLRSLFTLIWAAVILLGTLLFAEDDLRLALLVLTPVYFGVQLTQTPILILRRRVTHRRLAVVRLLQVILTTAVALPLAWSGAGLWALLAIDVIFLLVRIVVLYLWRPVWIPRLKWDPVMVRYYLNFGGRAFTAHALETAIDRVDDLWTGVYLGQAPLGIYSRAYTFATYPRQLLAEPLNNVASGMYAELKGDRPGLSSAFFRNNAFLIRAGFLLTGLLFLLAPELIFLLGEQWQDMLIPFRLMLLFVLLDPIRLTVGQLFNAVGQPQRLAWSRLLQLAVLLVGLFILGTTLGVNGVALAVNIMLLVGMVVLLWQARLYVDFSLWRLFAVPLLAFALAMGATLAVTMTLSEANMWVSALAKTLAFTVVYLVVWLGIERRDAQRLLQSLRRVYGKREQ